MSPILALLALFALVSCASAQIPSLVQCKLDALRILPEDPEQVTVFDSIDLIERLNACHNPPDAGK